MTQDDISKKLGRAGDSVGGGPPPERTPTPKAFLWCGGSTAGGGDRGRTSSSEFFRETFWRADLYRLLALGFERPTSSLMEVIRTITSELEDSSFGDDTLRELLYELKNETAQNFFLLEGIYHHLFTTQVTCSPCEGSYHLTERGPIIGDVMAFYRAFHMRPIACEGPPDSIKMELGFMSFLCLKQADTLEKNDLDSFQITFNAQKKFINDHLGRWAFQFADKLRDETDNSFYRVISSLLKNFLKKECQFLEVNPPPCPIKLRAAPSQEFVCEGEN